MTPFCVKEKLTGQSLPVPCGKCPNCLGRRVSAWSFRLMQEDKICETSHFITLTYDTVHVPITKNGMMTLNKRDLQLFFKRLRKAHGKGHTKIKYYACGEYGGKTNRPHYHIIMFNAQIELIQSAWGKGNVHYGQVSGASVGYTLKYISKPSRIPLHRNDDRLREFPLMSKGLGINYLSDEIKQWHLSDMHNRMHLTIENGKKVSMPRYYKDKLYNEHQRKAIAYYQKMEIAKAQAKQMKIDGDLYWSKKASQDMGAIKQSKFKSGLRDNL